MRFCIKCCTEKPLNDFTPRGGVLPNICRCCQSKNRMERKHKNGQKTKIEQAKYMREYRVRNAESILAKQIEQRKKNPLARLWKQLTTRKNVLNISREDFMKIPVPLVCPALGIPISHDLTRDNFPSVDRIDPNRPYEIGNIAIISYRANMIKSVGSEDEHRRISEWLSSFPTFSGKPLLFEQKVGPSAVKFGRKRVALESL